MAWNHQLTADQGLTTPFPWLMEPNHTLHKGLIQYPENYAIERDILFPMLHDFHMDLMRPVLINPWDEIITLSGF